MTDKPKLLLLGHTYMVAANREKAVALAQFYEVLVCTSDSTGWQALGKPIVDIPLEEHSGHYSLEVLPRFPQSQKNTCFTLRGLGRVISEFRPDVILAESEPWSLLRWQVRILAFLHAPKALFAEFSWENIPRPGIRGLFLKLIYRAAAATSQAVIAGNKGAKSLFENAGVPPENILVTGQLGISENDFPIACPEEKITWRRSLGWEEGAYVIGFCGRLVPEKGISLLAEAISELRAEFPNVKLAILGAGEIEKSLLLQDPDGELIHILPPVPHLLVGQFLNKLDMFVLPSRPLRSPRANWEEQFGHVLIEAITAGAFTIGSDSGAIPEVLADDEVIFRHSDSAAIRDLIRKWLQNPDLRSAKAAQQRTQCIARWNHKSLAEQYHAFFELFRSDPHAQ